MPKIVDHDAYRRTIIETAVQLFVTQGYSGLGMRELAGALGISKSALYHYYPSKEALFQDVVDAVVEVTVAELDAHPFAESSFVEKYAFFVDSIQANEERYVQDLLILTEYARLREDNAGAEQMHSAVDNYVSAIAAFLGVTPAAAQALYFQINGVLFQRLLDNRRTDLAIALAWVGEQMTKEID